MPADRSQTHTHVRQWSLPDGRTATTVHFVGHDGEESVELTGLHKRLDLTLESGLGHHEPAPADHAQQVAA
jgi:hypothetical protein